MSESTFSEKRSRMIPLISLASRWITDGARARVERLLDLLPGAEQRLELALERLPGQLLAHGADDDAAGTPPAGSPGPGLAGAPAPRGPRSCATRPRGRTAACRPGSGPASEMWAVTRGPLVLIGSLETCTSSVLALLHQVLDRAGSACRCSARTARHSSPLGLARPPRRLVLAGDVGDVEEGGLVGADVDEGGLDAREHRLDLAEVDVPDDAGGVGPIDHQLDEQRRPRGSRPASRARWCSSGSRASSRARRRYRARGCRRLARSRRRERMPQRPATASFRILLVRISADLSIRVRGGASGRSPGAGSRWCPRRSRRSWRRASCARPGIPWCIRSRHGSARRLRGGAHRQLRGEQLRHRGLP